MKSVERSCSIYDFFLEIKGILLTAKICIIYCCSRVGALILLKLTPFCVYSQVIQFQHEIITTKTPTKNNLLQKKPLDNNLNKFMYYYSLPCYFTKLMNYCSHRRDKQ